VDEHPPDEWTPRERGLALGNGWARRYATTDADVVAVATGHIPAELQARLLEEAALRARLRATSEPNPEGAFLDGFVHGVRAFLAEMRTGMGPN
jgi:hypothetical protein